MTSKNWLVIETDFFSDVDDVGALALAHSLTEAGEVELAAVLVNTPSRWGAPAVQVINGSYGAHNVRVGALTPVNGAEAERGYARQLVERFGSSNAGNQAFPSTTDVWRDVLARADNASVTVVSIGFFGSLCRLLESGRDAHSDAPGLELVSEKVAHTVVMGGEYPEGREFNFAANARETQQFLTQWPGTVDFVGFEAGAFVHTGGSHIFGRDTPAGYAYEIFCGPDSARESWDLIAVHHAVTGKRSPYSASRPGLVRVAADGSSSWLERRDGLHRILRLRSSPEDVGRAIDSILRRSKLSRTSSPPGSQPE